MQAFSVGKFRQGVIEMEIQDGNVPEETLTEHTQKLKKFVPSQLRAKADLYEERNKIYGDNYKRFGPILSLILAGQTLDTGDPDQMNRLGVFVQVVSKITRYGANFTSGGNDDCLDDNAVYSMMLKELDHESRRQN